MISAIQTNSIQCKKPVQFQGGYKSLSEEGNAVIKRVSSLIQENKIEKKINKDGWAEIMIDKVQVIKKNIGDRICFVFEKTDSNDKLFNKAGLAISDTIDGPFETIASGLDIDKFLVNEIAPALDKIA